MGSPDIEDVRWLVGERAEIWLRRAGADQGSPTALARGLRRELSAARARLVLAQVELRRRGEVKFRCAERMFFTRQLLEQATDERIADYKAGRFPAGTRVVDLCCGLGGDLQALARHQGCRGVDRDPVAAILAEANVRAAGHSACVDVADVSAAVLRADQAWHIDPDRRARGRRVTHLEGLEPAWRQILKLRPLVAQGAVKLAPATRCPAPDAEREWIGSRGECRQQVIWWGALARRPGHRATVIDREGGIQSLEGDPEDPMPWAERPGQYVFEPHPAVLAAGLAATLAAGRGLAQFCDSSAYLTSDARRPVPLAAAFELLSEVTVDSRRLRRHLRAHRWRLEEIKQRGAGLDLAALRTRLKCDDGDPVTLLIARRADRTWAALARRLQF